ncbi:MAG: hypothetical protein KAX33_12000 [Candidatus Lokiarchaeota archaeon]|nr:hypothetical protein [Candidatus Lokiarchaeota archaeon]
MQLYSVSENGALRKIIKVDFAENKVYLIDDLKTIYLWVGLKATKKKKNFGIKKANILNDKRKNTVKIQIINQNKEFGAFLAMMDILKKGIKQNLPIKKRPELYIEIEDTMELIDAGLDPDLEAEITVAAHNISQEKKTYDELCRELAETQLIILKGKVKASEAEIKKKTKEIYKSSSTYEEICWLLAELKILIEKNSFYKD